MAKQEQREVAINFQTNVSSTIDQLRDLQSTLDENSSEYSALTLRIEETEKALRDYDTLLESNIATEKQLLQAKKNLQKQFESNEKVIQKNTTATKDLTKEVTANGDATKDLTKEVTANGGAMAILDTITGGLASQFKNAYEATGLFTKGTIASAIGMKGASVGAKALRVALATIGIGLIISAVGYLVTNWDNLKKSFTDFLPSIGLTSDAFDKVKAVVVGVGGVIIDYLIAPIKAFIKLVQGDFKGAVNEIMSGYDVIGNFNKAKNNQIEKDNQAHRDKEFAKEVENDERNIERARNRGERTDKLEQDLINKKSKHYKKDSDEFKKNEIDKENFADRQIAERRKKAEADAQKRIERARETTEKLKQLEQERFEFDKKIQDLRDELFIGSAVNPTDELIKKNEIQIRKINEARDKELQDLKKLHKETSDSYKDASRVINETYDARVKKIEDSTGEVTKYYREYLGLSLEFIKDTELAVTPDSLLTYYDNVLKFIDGIKSSDIKKYYEEILKPNEVKENIKYIEDLHKTWMDFDEQSKKTLSEEDDLGSHKGLIRQNTRDQKALLEEQAEDQIQRLQDLKLLTKEEADILRESSEARMDLIDQMSEAELEAHNKEQKLRTEKLLNNEYALQLEKYFANMSYEIQLEQNRKLEELEEERFNKRRDLIIAYGDVTSAAASSQMQLIDGLLEFSSDADKERIKASAKYKDRMIALTTIDMLSGAVSAYTSAMGSTPSPITDQILGISSAAAVVATGLANIKKIKSVELKGASGGGGTSVGGAAVAPNVQFVSSSENQIANSVNANTNAQNQEPIKAYVVSGDVSSGQALERNKIESNSI